MAKWKKLLAIATAVIGVGGMIDKSDAQSVHDHSVFHGAAAINSSEIYRAGVGGLGALNAQLRWNNTADLDIHGQIPEDANLVSGLEGGRRYNPPLEDPQERHVGWYQRSLIFGGGGARAELDVDVRDGVANAANGDRVENITIEGSNIPSGRYSFAAHNYQNNRLINAESADYRLYITTTGALAIRGQTHLPYHTTDGTAFAAVGTLANRFDASPIYSVEIVNPGHDPHAQGIALFDTSGYVPAAYAAQQHRLQEQNRAIAAFHSGARASREQATTAAPTAVVVGPTLGSRSITLSSAPTAAATSYSDAFTRVNHGGYDTITDDTGLTFYYTNENSSWRDRAYVAAQTAKVAAINAYRDPVSVAREIPDASQTVLDTASAGAAVVPGAGELIATPADALNATISLGRAGFSEGDARAEHLQNAGLSAVGLLPFVTGGVAKVGKEATDRLPDDAIVCRGGSCSADAFRSGSGVEIDQFGNLQGVSVQSASEATANELAENFPHGQFGASTVGDIRQVGGDVVPSNGAGSHATLSGISPETAEELFTPTQRK